MTFIQTTIEHKMQRALSVSVTAAEAPAMALLIESYARAIAALSPTDDPMVTLPCGSAVRASRITSVAAFDAGLAFDGHVPVGPRVITLAGELGWDTKFETFKQAVEARDAVLAQIGSSVKS